MALVATATTTAITAASAAAAVGTFFAYLYFVGRSDANAARDEAMALAETRGEVIVDLRSRLAALEREHRKTTQAFEARVRNLEAALQTSEADAREQAYRIQRFYAAALTDILGAVQADLAHDPPNVANALERVRQLLDGERPAA
jgi:hypothetical protein